MLLLSAERCWAQAIHVKASRTEDNADKSITGSTRKHIISKLNKGSKYAKELATILSDKASGANEIDLLEAQAYFHSLSGAEEFEKQAEGIKDAEASPERWNECLRRFSVARVIYNALLKSTKKDIFKDFLSSSVDPSIRYAAYQARIPRTIAVSDVAIKYFPRSDASYLTEVERIDPEALSDSASKVDEKSGESAIPKTIQWRSRTANIVDAAIGQALASVRTAEQELQSYFTSSETSISTKDKAAAYDNILIASQDVTDATRHAIEELEKEGVAEGDPRMQDLRVTSLAVNYELIGWRVGRYRVLVGADDGANLAPGRAKKPNKPRKDGKEWVEKEEGRGAKLARIRERVVLYDSILQSIDSVKELRGAVRDTAFIQELDAKRAYYQALRCLNLAYSHTLTDSPHAPKNALALLTKAVNLSADSQSLANTPSTSSLPKLDPSPELVKKLQSHLSALHLHHRGLLHLHMLTASSEPQKQQYTAPLVQRLDTYPGSGADLGNLVTYPPKLVPVPVKPLFLDVAWNYIEYPTPGKKAVEQQEAKKQEPVAEAPKKKGWFGFGR